MDRPPDDGGPSTVAAAIDWTFPEAQSGNYSRIARYTTRLINSGKDLGDPRLDGWREVYGNADTDTYVEGWDFRYGYAVTSDSSHLWHIHLSESRDMTTDFANKDKLLSVLRGETVDEWGDDVSAKDVWTYDIDPTTGSYTAGGSMWTMMNRTGYLANQAIPEILALLNDIAGRIADLENAVYGGVDDAGGEAS